MRARWRPWPVGPVRENHAVEVLARRLGKPVAVNGRVGLRRKKGDAVGTQLIETECLARIPFAPPLVRRSFLGIGSTHFRPRPFPLDWLKTNSPSFRAISSSSSFDRGSSR